MLLSLSYFSHYSNYYITIINNHTSLAINKRILYLLEKKQISIAPIFIYEENNFLLI